MDYIAELGLSELKKIHHISLDGTNLLDEDKSVQTLAELLFEKNLANLRMLSFTEASGVIAQLEHSMDLLMHILCLLRIEYLQVVLGAIQSEGVRYINDMLLLEMIGKYTGSEEYKEEKLTSTLKQTQSLSFEGAILTAGDYNTRTLLWLINSDKLVNLEKINFENATIDNGVGSALATAIEGGKLPNLTQINMNLAKISPKYAERITAAINKPDNAIEPLAAIPEEKPSQSMTGF